MEKAIIIDIVKVYYFLLLYDLSCNSISFWYMDQIGVCNLPFEIPSKAYNKAETMNRQEADKVCVQLNKIAIQLYNL